MLLPYRPADVSESNLRDVRNVTLLSTIALGHATVHWFQQAFPLLLAIIARDMGLSNLAVGAVMSARSLTGAVTIAPMGIAADRFVSRRTFFMTAAIIWYGGAFFLISLVPNYVLLIFSVVLLGFGISLWHPPAMGLLSVRFPDRRAFVLAIHGEGAAIGDTLGPIIVGALLLVFSWRQTMQVSLPAALIFALVFLLVMRGLPVAAAHAQESRTLRQYFRALRVASKRPALILALLAGGMRTSGNMLLLTFLPRYAVDQLGIGPATAGLILGLLLGTGMFSQPILGYVSDRVGRKAVALPGLLMLVILTPMLGLAQGVLPIIMIAACIGLFLFSSGTVLGAIPLDVAPPELHGSVVAASFMVGLGFGTIAPTIGGAIADVAGIESSFYLAAALFFVAAVIVLFIPIGKGKARISWAAGS
jgi:MFS family permease